TVGNSVQYDVNFYISDGFPSLISIGCSGLGAGMACTANPAAVGRYQHTTVTVTTTPGVTPLQTRTIFVNGIAGGATHVAWNPQIKTTDYQLTTASNAVLMNTGSTLNTTMTLKSLNGFNKPVLLECGNLP